MGDCVIIEANARTADIQKHCFRTIEECNIKNVCVVNTLTMRWICIYCNKIMDITNFTQLVKESDNDKTSNQQAVVEYHGWRLLPD